MKLYALLCEELGTTPEDRRLLRALSCGRRFQGGTPSPSRYLQAASIALMAFAALVVAARLLA